MATGETAVLHCAFAGDVSRQAGTPCVNYGGNVGNIGADPAAWGPSADTCAHAGDHDCPALGLDGAPLNGRRGPFAATPVRTLSINFVGGKNASDEAYCVPDDPWQNYGLVSVPGSIWNNVRAVPAWSNGYTCSAVPVVSDGSEAALTFSANTVWVEPEMRDVFMKGFLDDTGGHPVFITVTDVPFASYDLWLYTSTDQNAQFRSFTVNGVAYTAGRTTARPSLPSGKRPCTAARRSGQRCSTGMCCALRGSRGVLLPFRVRSAIPTKIAARSQPFRSLSVCPFFAPAIVCACADTRDTP